MKRNVLFIDCCIRRELSRTRALADAMLGALRKREDLAITELCLMDEPLTYFSGASLPSASGCWRRGSGSIRAFAMRTSLHRRMQS